MAENKTSEAQIRATRNWEKRNTERKKFISYRTTARTFVRHWATKEDVIELVKIYYAENENAERIDWTTALEE